MDSLTNIQTHDMKFVRVVVTDKSYRHFPRTVLVVRRLGSAARGCTNTDGVDAGRVAVSGTGVLGTAVPTGPDVDGSLAFTTLQE